MNAELNRQVSEAQSLLEHGFQECLQLTLNLQHQIEQVVRNRIGFQSLCSDEILSHLYALAPSLYRVMADTLFRLVPLLQPTDCERLDKINFYFWPGYHSYLGNRRIFIQKKKNWNWGVGVCAAPDSRKLDHYQDCSQARWFHYMVKPRNPSVVFPGDIHRWLLRERPGGEAVSQQITSLTVRRESRSEGEADEEKHFNNHQVLYLGGWHQNSENWGNLFYEFVNQIGRRMGDDQPFTKAMGIVDQDTDFISETRAKLQALWLHSTFCAEKPVWLDSFIQDLASRDATSSLGKALRSALADRVAVNWGDATAKRPAFCSWTNLSLRSWLNPSKVYDFKSFFDDTEGERRLAKQTIGSAEILSSVPLRPFYLSFVRPWISEVYSTVRNAEIAILMHNQRLGAREPTFAGPYFAHEIKKLVDDTLSTMKRDVSDNSAVAIRRTRFQLHSIGAVTTLAYSFTNAVLSMNNLALEKERDRFLTPLRKLQQDGLLIESLRFVAREVYESVRREGGVELSFSHSGPSGWDPESLDEAQQSSCFLLVVEMIRNYCNDENSAYIARWSAALEKNSLLVRLAGPTRAQRNPTSMSFARLDVFLHSLGIGEASVFWDKQKEVCAYDVKVNLFPGGMSTSQPPKASQTPSVASKNRQD